jgi:hypothetical protein
MTRMLLAVWNECRHELEIRRPSGQVFRVRANQVTAGGHVVFAVQTSGSEVWVLTGTRGARQPRWRVRYTDTGVYRGTSAV